MRRPQRKHTAAEQIHHLIEELEPEDDPAVARVNIAALIVALIVAAFAYFLWTHPNYVPACNATGYRARCPPHLPATPNGQLK